VDLFVIYDNIKYTKKGWINRNRFLLNGAEQGFTVPLRRASDSLDVKDRSVAGDFDRGKLANQFREAYRDAPHFQDAFPVIEEIVMSPLENLFEYIHGSVVEICRYLRIRTRIVVSSSITADRKLKGQDRVWALCDAMGASAYVNAIGGQELYSREDFEARGIKLDFLRPHAITYPQFGKPFVPWLSIVDVMMFNPIGRIREFLETSYELV
jgi:hypothetical protein